MAEQSLIHTEPLSMILRGREAVVDLSRPRIMGILNVTPDSFSDGGRYHTPEAAVNRALDMVSEGADIIDIGGESTRPGAPEVPVEEELQRVIPVIRSLRQHSSIPISVDTWKSGVAAPALAEGADFINDISGFQFDKKMPEVVAQSGAGVFLMHTRGRPCDMQRNTVYENLVAELTGFFEQAVEKAQKLGIEKDRIAIDPGIGFAKDLDGNLTLLKELETLTRLGFPVLVGASRKSFIGGILDRPTPAERVSGGLAVIALGVRAGARLFRVHDVAASRDAALVAWRICTQNTASNAGTPL